MRLSRAIAILTILLSNEKVNMNMLAEKFEVSKRTIQRDIDTLALAGLPILTISGHGGGVKLMDEFTIDKSLISKVEMEHLLIGLQSIESISDAETIAKLISKFKVKSKGIEKEANVSINLSSYYSESISSKIEILKSAIDNRNIVVFDYYSARGKSFKTMKPFHILYEWESWYLWGKDDSMDTARIYKLNRLWNLGVSDNVFSSEEIIPYTKKIEDYYKNGVLVVIKFETKVKYRLVESYGPNSFECHDEYLLFKRSFENTDYFISWLLSFGSSAELLSPPELVDKVKKEIEILKSFYK